MGFNVTTSVLFVHISLMWENMVLGGLTWTAPYNNVGDTTLIKKVINYW